MVTWDRSVLRRCIVALVIIKVVGLVLIFDFARTTTQPFDLPKALYSRATEWLLAGLVIAGLYRYGATIVPRTRFHLLVFAYAAVNVASVLVAENQYVALYGDWNRFLGLTFVGDMIVLYLAVAVAFRSDPDYVALVVSVGVAAALSIAFAWMQAFGLDPSPWTVDPRIRPFSTLGHPNMYGHFLSVVFGVALGAAVLVEGRWAGVIRLGAGVLALAVLVTVGRVATRGTAIGVAVTLFSVAFMYLRLRGRNARTVLRLVGAGSLALILATTVLVYSPLGPRIVASFYGVATSDRLLVYDGALRAIADRPLLGYGPDNFGVAWPRYRQTQFAGVVGANMSNDSAHDWVLQAAATTGILGLAALVALIAASSWRLWRLSLGRDAFVARLLLLAAIAYWANAAVSVGTTGVDWVPWVVFGAAVALSAPTAMASARPGWLHVVIVPAILVIALVGSLTGGTALRANQEALRAEFATQLAQGDDAVAAANAAVTGDPGRSGHWNSLGKAYFLLGRWKDSVDAFSEAARRAPHDATYWGNRALALLQLSIAGDQTGGGATAALDSARHAVAIDPNEPRARATLAEIAMAVGAPEEALRQVVKLMELDPTRPTYDALAVRAALQLSDTALARGLLSEIVRTRESAALRVGLAQLALRANDRASAHDNARRALELDPRNPEAREIFDATGR